MRNEKRGMGFIHSEKFRISNLKFLIFIFSLLTFHFSLFTFPFSFLTSDRAWGRTKQEELKDYRDRIKEEKRRVERIEKRERSVLSELEVIEKAIKEKEKEFKDYDQRLKDTEKKLRKAEERLSLLNKRIEDERNNLRERLRAIYKLGRRGYYYGVLIGARDMESFFRRYKYLKIMAVDHHRLIDSYNEDRIQLNRDMASLEMLKKEVSTYREKVKTKEEELKVERKKKLILLSSLKKEKTTRERLIQELEEAVKRLETLIKEADKKIETPSIPGVGFSAQKGRLPWPVEGRLVGLFGRQIDPEFKTPIFKRGIEIRTQSSDDIRAIYKGTVLYADWFKGYGKMLILNHGDRYYSLYAHASEIFPKVGETVSEGQIIGKVGDTGSIRGPILYFEIRHKGEPLDPLAWLRGK